MRMPSTKSVPSPVRLDQPVLSVSRSRRLRNSGSVKKAPLPGLFGSVVSVGNRKKNGSFETVEPSSPKVSCIGQVRVKTGRKNKKKKKKKTAVVMRSISKRVVGEEIEGFANASQNQKWVHLPLESICEAVKAFGSEINCFSPCGGDGGGNGTYSSGGEKDKVGKRGRGGGAIGSCGTTLARCLLAIEEEREADDEKKDHVGVIDVGVMAAEDLNASGERVGSRREAMREVELLADELHRRGFLVEEIGAKKENVDVCIPPRNALLLMRCRSDPVRMSELATRFGSFPVRAEEASGSGGEYNDIYGSSRDPDSATSTSAVLVRDVVAVDVVEAIVDKDETFLCIEKTEDKVEDKEKFLQEIKVNSEVKDQDFKENEHRRWNRGEGTEKEEEKEEEMTLSLEENLEAEKKLGMLIIIDEEEEEETDVQIPSVAEQPKESKFVEEKKSMEKEQRRWSFSEERRRHSFSTEKDVKGSSSYKVKKETKRSSFSFERQSRRSSFSSEMEFRRRRHSFSSEKQGRKDVTLLEKLAEDAEEKKNAVETQKPIQPDKETELKSTTEEKNKKELPDCLLMTMYEPKLSMEVSRETWVCKADFVRPNSSRLPSQKQLQPPKPDQVSTCAATTEEADTKEVQEPPSSDPSKLVKQEVEQKVGNAALSIPSGPFGPFVLTRCKSEPPRSSAKLLPDAIFWKNRHQPISTAGIGF